MTGSSPTHKGAYAYAFAFGRCQEQLFTTPHVALKRPPLSRFVVHLLSRFWTRAFLVGYADGAVPYSRPANQ